MDIISNETDRLEIKVMESADIEEARRLHNDDSTLSWLTHQQHVTEEEQKLWFASISISKTSRRYVARLKSDREFIGVFRIDGIDQCNRNALVGADVVGSKRRLGFATEMFNYFLGYLFNQCGMHRLALKTMENNKAGMTFYKKLGFIEEGRDRQAILRNGQFWDLVNMSILESEWRK